MQDEGRVKRESDQILNRLRRLEYQIRSVGPQVSTDLDELGAVQTVLQFNETFAPGTFPPLGVLYLYMDESDDHLKLLDSTGSVLDLSAGGTGGAPTNAQYLVLAANATLTVERIFTPGTALTGVDSGAGGAFTLNHAQVATGDLHQDYPLHASPETISGAWTFSALLTMSGADLRLAAAGSIEDSGGTNRITLTAGGEGLLTNDWRVSGELEIDGDLDHDGTNVGFYGATPTPQSAAYTPTNVTTDRTYDANATTVDELADVLGTLIADLQATGLIG